MLVLQPLGTVASSLNMHAVCTAADESWHMFTDACDFSHLCNIDDCIRRIAIATC